MSEDKKVGRPKGRAYTTLLIGVTEDELRAFNAELEEYKHKNGLDKLSKSQFARSLLMKGLNAIKRA